jgi:hypothetical protein
LVQRPAQSDEGAEGHARAATATGLKLTLNENRTIANSAGSAARGSHEWPLDGITKARPFRACQCAFEIAQIFLRTGQGVRLSFRPNCVSVVPPPAIPPISASITG